MRMWICLFDSGSVGQWLHFLDSGYIFWTVVTFVGQWLHLFYSDYTCMGMWEKIIQVVIPQRRKEE